MKAITDAHGGRCWITSAPGRGTTVHVALPTARTVVMSEV